MTLIFDEAIQEPLLCLPAYHGMLRPLTCTAFRYNIMYEIQLLKHYTETSTLP